MKSQFRNLKFTSKEDFDKWLKENTFITIDLYDLGQDIQKIWIHKTGEILNCDFSSLIYAGKFVDTTKLNVGDNVHIWDERAKRYSMYKRFVVCGRKENK